MEGDVNADCRYAKATHNFVATKTDELNLTRNEILIITQAVDGGWWEGTNADGKTGWFPSNYVEELDKSQAAQLRVAQQRRVSVAHYRVTVLQTVIDTERAYYSELHRLCDVLLRPLSNSALAHSVDLQRGIQCVTALVALHGGMLNALGECVRTSSFKQRIGGLFLKLAPELKRTYETYFGVHPALARLIASRRPEIDAAFAAAARSGDYSSLNTNELIISLSSPFNRLEKYSSLLKEIERHTDEAHLDRGDTQRAVVVLRDVYASCVELRKRKERELDILEGAAISGIDTNELRRLGEVVYSGACRAILCAETERNIDGAYLVLFSNYMIVLSTNTDLSGYRLEDRFATQSCVVQQLDSVASTTQPGGKSYPIEFADRASSRRCVAILRSNAECSRWLEVLRGCMMTRSGTLTRPAPPNSLAQGALPPATRLSNSVPGSPQNADVPPNGKPQGQPADVVDNQHMANSNNANSHGLKRASTVGGSLKNGAAVDQQSQPVARSGGLKQFRSAAPLRPFGNADDGAVESMNISGSTTQTGNLASSVASPNVSGGLASLVSRSSARPHSKDDSFIRSPKPNRKMTRKQSQKVTPEDLYGKQADPKTVAEDYRILEVVDAYCVSHLRNRQTLQQPRARSVAPDDLRMHVAALSAAANSAGKSQTQTSGYLDILTIGGSNGNGSSSSTRKLPPRSPPRSAFDNVNVAQSRLSKPNIGASGSLSATKDISDEKQQLLLSLLPKVGSANIAARDNAHVHAYACCPVCTAPPVQHAAHCPAANAAAGGQNQHDAAPVYAVPYRTVQQGGALTPLQHTLLQSALNPHGAAKLSGVPQHGLPRFV